MKRSIRNTAVAAGLALAVAALGTVPASAGGHKSQELDIVRTAQKAGSFKTLLKAVHRAGLTQTLKMEGPFTVFAPTDEAFAKVPAEALKNLMKDREALRNVLLYHVVPGEVTSDEVVALTSATAANGGTLTISVSGSSVMVNDANVVAVDVMAENGVVHVIDSVLLP